MGRAGALCIRHDVPVARTFPRGRPYVLEAVLSAAQSAELVDEPLAVLAFSAGETRY